MTREESKAEGRRALVTGGANGIGWAACRALAKQGYRLALADIDGNAARERAEALGEGHVALAIDLTDRDAAAALPARAAALLGGLDVIVNNAGVTDSSGRALVELPQAAFDRLVDLNLSAVEAICEASRIVLAPGSAIVNLASGASFKPLALRGPYSATKAGIAALTRASRDSFAALGIGISAVAPGYTRTPLVDELHRTGRVDLDKVIAGIPLGRMATPDDIASAIAFMASPQGGVLAGETILVDGGGLAGPAPAGAAPLAGSEADGRIAVIGASGMSALSGWQDVVRMDDPAGLGSAGPLSAVIDMRGLMQPCTAGETLRRVRQTAVACAAHPARTANFSLLFVHGEGRDPGLAAATAAGGMLARTLALEWAPAGMRVNAVAWRGAAVAGLEALCRYLASDGAGMITGQEISAGLHP
ncbi:SDR family oxidoreductase [Aquibium sp. ELW1220]|uniref:SDR family oxidoreductase n=1 Tax=Aquibium sp. ELW1220 TaxID=2976766 RepID=UPI0025B01D6B|nr:SDR family oxidoreductase [Aquibium sp. ELW1220]MDN2581192.1 SDR family oxidoreductase [Aquibium sp. ELW1220]